jgi:hypothetical protein
MAFGYWLLAFGQSVQIVAIRAVGLAILWHRSPAVETFVSVLIRDHPR